MIDHITKKVPLSSKKHSTVAVERFLREAAFSRIKV